jgi:cob(I)alamin adenosyltransferase
MAKSRSITTKVGDKGTTFLLSGEEVPKDSPRTEAYGDLDEVVSALGVAKCLCRHPGMAETLAELQRDLFVAGAELATSADRVAMLARRIDADMLAALESRSQALEGQIEMPRGFVLPGAAQAAAHLDVARAIARRCERKVAGLVRSGLVGNRHLLIWFNRLSDYLWLLARQEEGARTELK